MIFGIFGMTRVQSLIKLDVNDVTEQGSGFVIKVPDANGIRSFTVEDIYATYVQKYKDLRPKNVYHSRFFIHFQNGHCTAQPIGKNKFCNVPKIVANFLKLKDADSYSCNSFRQKSLKHIRGMKATTRLDSFIDECPPKKIKMADLI